MTQKSLYNEKAGVVLNCFLEDDIALLNKHSRTKRVAILVEGQHLENLEFLVVCDRFEELAIYGGKIDDYSALEKLPKLNNLFMNGRLRRWLEKFDFLKNLTALEELGIYNYPMFSCFRNLQDLQNLHSVRLWGCKRLMDISNVALIPNLKSFGIVSTPHTVEDIEFIA